MTTSLLIHIAQVAVGLALVVVAAVWLVRLRRSTSKSRMKRDAGSGE